ncbi:hypothetical protein KC19_7G142100 [Ceratodon purpureus]|uniref:Uncharacterized protein n=1 Tax=Ceratodon purpureus TaxID=3225 RepID=A0A8T0HA70_CERPU|nr:hypothetical protein KC19_7G142100 [Ceratodon purpureus]
MFLDPKASLEQGIGDVTNTCNPSAPPSPSFIVGGEHFSCAQFC